MTHTHYRFLRLRRGSRLSDTAFCSTASMTIWRKPNSRRSTNGAHVMTPACIPELIEPRKKTPLIYRSAMDYSRQRCSQEVCPCVNLAYRDSESPCMENSIVKGAEQPPKERSGTAQTRPWQNQPRGQISDWHNTQPCDLLLAPQPHRSKLKREALPEANVKASRNRTRLCLLRAPLVWFRTQGKPAF